MPVRRRVDKRRRELTEAERHVLFDGSIEDADLIDTAKIYFAKLDSEELWVEHKEWLLPEWVDRFPGTRPQLWWDHSAPRMPEGTFPGRYYDGKLPQPRQRIGGVGTPKFEVLAWIPRYAYGLPVDWVSAEEAEIYNGSPDAEGNPLARQDGTRFAEGDFAGLAIDPRNPPKFESQATYLDRHGLLLPGERRRLTERDFRPETLAVADDDEAPAA